MPTAKVQTPDGRTVTMEVPKRATQEQILSFARSQFAPQQPQQADQQQAPQDQGFNLGRAALGVGKKIAGGAEVAGTLLTGAVAEPIAGIAGLLAPPLASAIGVESKSPGDVVRAVQKGMTFTPETEEGKKMLAAVGGAIEPVAKFADKMKLAAGEATQGAVESLTGSEGAGRVAGAAVETIPAAAAEFFGMRGTRSLKQAAQQEKALTASTPSEIPRFDETGIRATTGELDQAKPGGFDLLKQEQLLLGQSGPAGEQLRGFKLAQSQEVEKFLSDMAPSDAQLVGPAIKDAIELRRSSAKFKRKQAYDVLAEVTKDTDLKLSHTPIINALPDAGELADFAAINPGQSKAVDNLMAEFGLDASKQAADFLEKNNIDLRPLSVDNAEAFRKRLGSIEKSDATGNTGRIVGPMRSALDEEFDLASLQLERLGSESVARAAKNARLSNVALKKEFDESGLVDRLIAPKKRGSNIPKIENSDVYAQIASKSTKPEQVQSLMDSLKRAGTKGRVAREQLKSRLILDLLDSGFKAKSRKIQGQRVFGATPFISRLDDLTPKLQAIFTKSEMDRLSALKKNATDLIPPSGAVPKGSAGFFVDSLQKMGVWALLDKGLPGIGPLISQNIKSSVKESINEKLLRKSTQAKKDTIKLIETDYPSLAAALAIGSPAPKDENKKQKLLER
jgi:hypothetical protein